MAPPVQRVSRSIASFDSCPFFCFALPFRASAAARVASASADALFWAFCACLASRRARRFAFFLPTDPSGALGRDSLWNLSPASSSSAATVGSFVALRSLSTHFCRERGAFSAISSLSCC